MRISSKKLVRPKKSYYRDMIANRRHTDGVCQKQKQLRDKYKEYVGRYDKASMHLRWRLAHGCFYHGLGHYCAQVSQWCGSGQNTHPCQSKAVISPPPQEAQSQQLKPTNTSTSSSNASSNTSSNATAGLMPPSSSAVSFLQLPPAAPHHTINVMKIALKRAAWPQRNFCFHHKKMQHCVKVLTWLRNPGVGLHGTAPSQRAFLPDSLTVNSRRLQ